MAGPDPWLLGGQQPALEGRVVGTTLRLANGKEVWGILGNITTGNPRMTRHFLTVSVLRNGKWFTMARYHDVGYEERGPDALATFLGLSTDQVFPVRYDVRSHSEGDPTALAGAIPAHPAQTLTRGELIALAVEGENGG